MGENGDLYSGLPGIGCPGYAAAEACRANAGRLGVRVDARPRLWPGGSWRRFGALLLLFARYLASGPKPAAAWSFGNAGLAELGEARYGDDSWLALG
jgi:hypothetical protein